MEDETRQDGQTLDRQQQQQTRSSLYAFEEDQSSPV